MKTLVLGLGNPILGDDGVGWQVATALQRNEEIPSDVTIDCLAIGGFSLMETLIGYDRAILIDAMATHQVPIGSVNHYQLAQIPFPHAGHMTSAHDTSLQNALEVGRSLGAHLPKDISVVAIEAHKVYDFSEELSQPVADALPEAISIIMKLLIESQSDASAEGLQNKLGGTPMVSPEILRRYPFFGSLSDAQLKAVAMIAEEETFKKGAVICEEGQPAKAFFLLIDGNLSLYYKTQEEFRPDTRKDFLVGEIDPGEIFAISILVEPYIYTATVKAEKDSRVVRFDADGINRLIEKDPRFYCTLMREIAKAAMERLAFARVQLAAAWVK